MAIKKLIYRPIRVTATRYSQPSARFVWIPNVHSTPCTQPGHIPILALADIEERYQSDATSYIVKPMQLEAFAYTISNIEDSCLNLFTNRVGRNER